MKVKNRWRPSKINDISVGKLEEAFKRDATVWEACAYAEISRDTFYDNYNKNKHFSDKIDAARMFPHIFAKKTLFERMKSSDEAISLKAAIEFLKRRNEDYKDKSENTNTNFNNESKLTEEDMQILNKMRNNLTRED